MKPFAPFFILAILFSSFSTNAQEGFFIGFSGNVGTSFIVNQNTYGVKWNVSGIREFELAYKAKLGYGGGLNLGYNFQEQLGIQLKTSYYAGGMKYEDTDRNGVVHKKNIDLSYITIAPVFKYSSIFKKNRYKQHQTVRLAIVAGPQIGILLNGNMEYSLEADGITVDDETLNYPYEFNLYNQSSTYTDTGGSDKDFFSNIDFGLTVEVGVDIYPKEWFYISPTLKTYVGLIDVNNETYRIHSGYGPSKNFNMGLNVSMGFFFNR